MSSSSMWQRKELLCHGFTSPKVNLGAIHWRRGMTKPVDYVLAQVELGAAFDTGARSFFPER